MLARVISKSSQINRFLRLSFPQSHLTNPKPISQRPISSDPTNHFRPRIPHFRFFSANGGNGSSGEGPPTSTDDLWKLSSEGDSEIDSVFSGVSEDGESKRGVEVKGFDNHDWNFGGVGDQSNAGDDGLWKIEEAQKEGDVEDLFGVKNDGVGLELSGLGDGIVEKVKTENDVQLEAEEKELIQVLKGPNRAFGDLIASSGITDEMLDSLIALKDFEGIQGLPPLSEIEEKRYEKNTGKKSSGDGLEGLTQSGIVAVRVRKVDEKGRAYGTGKRKCSIARVWINPGDGKFFVNDKEFDVYFPMLDQRAALLRPFSETKTLGMWDVNCTVKGGGFSGQVGAIRLGISRALQNWEPGFRPPLKQAGFLTRDSRIVERKKPGKAKARKSFQWVKR